jgi:hypothetical protein
MAACPTNDPHFLGHCIPAADPTFASATYNYGETSQVNSIKLSCTAGGGTWCPAN